MFFYNNRFGNNRSKFRVSIPASGIFVFLLEDLDDSCFTDHVCFNPGERDFCFSTVSEDGRLGEQKKFQSRRAGFLFFYLY